MNRWIRTGLGVAGILAAFVTVLGGVMFFRQESLVYFPETVLSARPEDFGLPCEEVRLATSDGPRIAAWWIPAPNPRGAVILAHGNGGNRSHRLDKAILFRELGLSTLLFDYRGYGGSEGNPSETGTYRDMDAAVDHAHEVRSVAPERTIFWGESLGAAVAVETATRRPCGGLVVESGFASLPAMARAVYPWVPGFMVRMRYDSLGRIPRISAPKLILHGPSDEVVPYRMGRDLYAAAQEPKRFSDLAGGHNGGGILTSPEAQRALREFLDEVLGP